MGLLSTLIFIVAAAMRAVFRRYGLARCLAVHSALSSQANLKPSGRNFRAVKLSCSGARYCKGMC